MSVRVMSAVFDRYPSKGAGETLLALALADVARDDGALMLNDSVDELARKTRQSRRGVQLQLRRMEHIGWLHAVRASDGGRGRCSVYRIDQVWIGGGELVPPVAAETANPAASNRELGSPSYRPLRPNTNTPQPPKGGKPDLHEPKANAKPVRKPSQALSLPQWLDRCKADGLIPIPPDDAVHGYCAKVRIGDDILALHWAEFKLRRSENAKRQADWRRTFRNSVRDNWFRLWFIAAGQPAQLTTTGRQAQAAHAFHVDPA